MIVLHREINHFIFKYKQNLSKSYILRHRFNTLSKLPHQNLHFESNMATLDYNFPTNCPTNQPTTPTNKPVYRQTNPPTHFSKCW